MAEEKKTTLEGDGSELKIVEKTPQEKKMETAFNKIWKEEGAEVELDGIFDWKASQLLKALCLSFFETGAEWQKEQDDIIGKAISYFGAESLLDNANGLTDFEKFTAWLYCEFLRGLPKKLNQDYIKEQSKVILGAIKKELGKMPDSTELIAQWDAEREMLEQKDFRGDEWRLAQNAFFDGFGSGYLVRKEQDDKETADLLAIAHLQGMEQQKKEMMKEAFHTKMRYDDHGDLVPTLPDMSYKFQWCEKVIAIIFKSDE